MKSEKVVVLGASDNPERISNQAFRLLQKHGHTVIPVNPRLKELDGMAVVPTLDKVQGPVDTLTIYVNAEISSALQDSILSLKPRRVIFNPGSENPALQKRLKQEGIPYLEECTLVLLRSQRY